MSIVALNVRPAIDVGRCSCCRQNYGDCSCEDWERGRDAARSGQPTRLHDLDRPRRAGV